jgi:Asparagine synthase
LSHRAIPGAPQTAGQSLSPYSSQLTGLELASGLVLGEDPDAKPLPEVDPSLDPVDALGEAIIPLLERPPCLVAFSGGRDSSAVLAVATAVARREGLDLPIPITQRFPRAAAADESDWQEMVINHVKPPDWHRQVVLDELDFIGPVATQLLLRHGVLWPPNSHGLLPMLQQARGGSLLTGLDGDSVFRTWRWARAASVLGLGVRPGPRDALRIALAIAPRSARRWRLRRKDPLELRWLRSDALEKVQRIFFAQAAGEPFKWDRRIHWLARQRYLAVTGHSARLIADRAGATIGHPLLDPRFLASLACAGGALGFGDVNRVMHAQFGSLLPAEVVARRDKVGFDEVFWGRRSREFMTTWAGRRVPIEFVDDHGLLETWREPTPHAASSAVLQALWLANEGDGQRAAGGTGTS